MGYDFTPLNLSFSYLEGRGAYLLDTGIEMFIWIGREAPPSLIQQILGRIEEASHYLYTSQDIADPELLEFIRSCKWSCGVFQGLSIFMNSDAREQSFFSKLVEDATVPHITYPEFYARVTQNLSVQYSGNRVGGNLD
mmetsp:Transcript_30912/g.30548  ORF Transcript_30912/g.30548 Transcript_30912/m.30548 type:complete len:138 (-) Transcript_30912:1046-1459(-)